MLRNFVTCLNTSHAFLFSGINFITQLPLFGIDIFMIFMIIQRKSYQYFMMHFWLWIAAGELMLLFLSERHCSIFRFICIHSCFRTPDFVYSITPWKMLCIDLIIHRVCCALFCCDSVISSQWINSFPPGRWSCDFKCVILKPLF